MDWVGIGIIVVVGIAVIAYGWLSDRTANRRRAEELNAPPDRPIPGLNTTADAPMYVHPDELDAKPSLPADELSTLRDRLSSATSLPHGHGKGAFASDHASGLAVLTDPLILIVDGDLSSTRDLLPVIAKAVAASRPLVVVAERIAADVYHTLEVNTLAGKLASDAVPITDPGRRAHLAELVDATPISPANLKSGWVPDASLGTCGTWVSSPTQLWLLHAS